MRHVQLVLRDGRDAELAVVRDRTAALPCAEARVQGAADGVTVPLHGRAPHLLHAAPQRFLLARHLESRTRRPGH